MIKSSSSQSNLYNQSSAGIQLSSVSNNLNQPTGLMDTESAIVQSESDVINIQDLSFGSVRIKRGYQWKPVR